MTTRNQTQEGLEAITATRPLLTPESVCYHLAELFKVRPTEVGLLQMQGAVLRFVFPRELAHVGSIPLNSNAVAARIARTQRAELFNDFVKVPHWSIFESVRLHDAEKTAPMVIQKLMSAPIVARSGVVVGVLQISRKGATRQEAGPDFGADDLQRLKLAAAQIAPIMLLLTVPDQMPRQKLSFCNQAAEQKRV
ncbi:MAG: GAF domain-containing protein [Acidobacteriia bacterium]|nr:GAF domain-containing protein [Terriglobia bacterium]